MGDTITAIKSGNFSDATTWDLDRVPVSGDIIDTAGYTVTYDPDFQPRIMSWILTQSTESPAPITRRRSRKCKKVSRSVRRRH